MNWYEEWFNSPYYHFLYANRNEEEAENFIHKISSRLKIKSEACVLDVACGKGRHSKTLAKLGLNVTGIDLSENNIAEAKKTECANLHYKVWDMREVFRKSYFDYVFNLFSSFGYFENDEDDRRAIKAMNENLKQGGILILDYINTEFAVKNLKAREIISGNGIQFHVQKKTEDGFIVKQIDFIANGENHSYHECLKVINRFNFEEMLKQTGFELKNVLGDYDLNDFVASTSPRLILIAEKK